MIYSIFRPLAVTLLAIISVSLGVSAQAATRTTGMFGVVSGQVARINAVNIGDVKRTIRFDLAFVDASGTIVARETVTISFGQATFFDFKFDKVGRQQLRALIIPQNTVDLPSTILRVTSNSSTVRLVRPTSSTKIPTYRARGICSVVI